MPRFNIEGHLHRLEKGHLTSVWTRHYARIETAVRRCTEFLILEGEKITARDKYGYQGN